MKVSRAVSNRSLVSFCTRARAWGERSRFAVSVVLCAAFVNACQKTPVSGDSSNSVGAASNPPPNEAVAAPALALQTAELMVEGTSCASCAVTIRRHLHQLQGIGDIREGSTKQHLLVEFDPTLVTAEQLIKAVSDAGYEAEVWVHAAGAASMRQQGG